MDDWTTPDRRLFAAGLIGAALTPSLSYAQHEPSRAIPLEPLAEESMPIARDAAERMTVPVMLNGKGPFPFVVDTGSNRTVVSDVLAGQLDLPASGLIKVRAATGPVQTPSARVASLTVGRRHMSNFKAPVLAAQHLGALGMLGIDAVADQRVVMDFRRKQMTIEPTTSRASDDPNALTVRAKSKYGQLLLVDSSVEDVSLYVIIDTGGEVTIGNSTMRAKLARRRAERAEQVQVISVTGDTADADLTMLPRLNVGNVVVLNQPIAYADLYAFDQFGLRDKPAMFLGMSTLRHFAKVSLDFPAREVRFVLA